LVPEGKAQQMWAAFKKNLDVVDGRYQKSGSRWIIGDTFSFLDIVVVSWMVWWK
jgi:glutathione S-transferase